MLSAGSSVWPLGVGEGSQCLHLPSLCVFTCHAFGFQESAISLHFGNWPSRDRSTYRPKLGSKIPLSPELGTIYIHVIKTIKESRNNIQCIAQTTFVDQYLTKSGKTYSSHHFETRQNICDHLWHTSVIFTSEFYMM